MWLPVTVIEPVPPAEMYAPFSTDTPWLTLFALVELLFPALPVIITLPPEEEA